jgi:ADP-ribose pyrophosphatase YjhB (NUDIX family)
MAIRCRAICVFRRGDSILVSFAVDPRSGGCYARVLGGAIEEGERAADAVRREMREELGVEITEPQLLGVLENIFELDGRTWHEIVFVFDADFADAEDRARSALPVNESACIAPATWVPLDAFGDETLPIYPRDVVRLLHGG